jgi:hypothetical protein
MTSVRCEVVDGDLGVRDQVEHGEEDLAVLGEEAGQCGGIGLVRGVLPGNDVVVFGHRWWLLCGIYDIPMIRDHRSPEPSPIFQPSTMAGTSSNGRLSRNTADIIANTGWA